MKMEYDIGERFYAADPEFMDWFEENGLQEYMVGVDDTIRSLLTIKGKIARALAKKIREYYPDLEKYEFTTSISFESPPTVHITAKRNYEDQ